MVGVTDPDPKYFIPCGNMITWHIESPTLGPKPLTAVLNVFSRIALAWNDLSRDDAGTEVGGTFDLHPKP